MAALPTASVDVAVAQPSAVDRVVLVVLENQNYDRVIRDPTFKRLADEGLLFSNAHSHNHPSYLNYIGLVAGQVPTVLKARQPHQLEVPMLVDIESIADRLDANGKTWKNYAEDYPGGCRLDDHLPTKDAPLYVRRHVPFLSFTRVTSDTRRCANVVNATQFEVDRQAGALPHFSFYSPNMCNSGHGSRACPFDQSGAGSQEKGLKVAASWLEGFVAALRSDSASWSRLLLVVTFDEADYFRHPAGAKTNRVYTLFLGDMVRPGTVSRWVSHYHILRSPITEIWK
jgi:phospholipase C